MRKCIIPMFFLWITSSLFAQKSSVISPKHFREKVYVHTDKAYYYQDENIWFSAYMNYDSPGMVDTLSKVLYLELISPSREIVRSSIVKLDSGRGSGVLSLMDNLPQGNYILRAYTNWMRNYGVQEFFYKSIPILGINYTIREKVPKVPATDNQLKIVPDKSIYKTRERVKLKIHFDQPVKDKLQSGSLSVSVTDETLVVPVGGGPNIMNDYHLPDELPSGMLTKFKYPVETGVWLRGVTSKKNRKGDKGSFTVVQEGLAGIYKVTPNDTGVFVLKDLSVYDSVKFLVNGGTGKTTLLAREVPVLPKILPTHGLRWVRTDTAQRISYGNNIKTQMLKEVEIKSTRRERQYENPYGKPDYYIKSASMEGYSSLALAIVAKCPGFALAPTNGHQKLVWVRSQSIFAAQEPVVFIDQAQVMTGSGETMGDKLDSMNPFMIDHVEISSMINSSLGANGAAGSIYVFSKRYDPTTEKAPLLKLRGFDKPTFFESPNYHNPTTDTTLPDFRSTLYWNPKVTFTSRQPIAELTFFTSDRPGKYRVIVEGIRNKEIPIHAEVLLEVE